jgi:hypothetical protein
MRRPSRVTSALLGIPLLILIIPYAELLPRVLAPTSAQAAESSHVTRGWITASVVGANLVTGLALNAQEPTPQIGFRQTHMVTSLALLGLALYEVDALSGKTPNPRYQAHRTWAYAYWGILAASAVAGLIQVRSHAGDGWDQRNSSSFQAWSAVHTGLSLSTAAALTGVFFTAHFD